VLRLISLSLMVGLLALPIAAHHSFAAEYDGKKPVSLKGTVTQIDWRNPHAYFMLEVKNEAGAVTTIHVEGHPPNTLRRTGWVKDVLKVKDSVTVAGWESRDGSTRIAGREVTLANGKKLFWGPPSE
jgi:Family of unknown function (DUF6152)